MALKKNTWTLNQWYDQDVAGNVSYSGAPELWTWGRNTTGSLGQNDRTSRSSPVQIPGTTWSRTITTSPNESEVKAAIRTDGTLWTWGHNDWGQLGQNNKTDYSSPTQVPGSNWAAITCIHHAMMATKTDGTLWSWGYNYGGKLGLNEGANSHKSSPVQVGSDTTWTTDPKMIGGGGGWARAFVGKSDGTMWCWGDNNYGRLGINTNQSTDTRFRSSPVQLGTDTNWSHISDGTYGTLLLNTDGELFGFGDAANGDLAQNDTVNRSSPTQIPGTWGWMSSSYNAKFAVRSDGTAYSWGNNDYGQLGHNSRTKYSSPVQIPGTWSKISINGCYSYIHGLKTDGTLWGWGVNTNGNIGDTTKTQRSSPVQIPGDWTDVNNDNWGVMAMKTV